MASFLLVKSPAFIRWGPITTGELKANLAVCTTKPDMEGILKMSLQWFALRSKPNKDGQLWREIHAQGFEVFYPHNRVQPVNPRSCKVHPYFPDYLFVHIDLPAVGISPFIWMPQSYGLEAFGTEPPSVPEELIHSPHRRVKAIYKAGVENLNGLKHGETIGIEGCPFTGY
jgi:hypothetical protein